MSLFSVRSVCNIRNLRTPSLRKTLKAAHRSHAVPSIRRRQYPSEVPPVRKRLDVPKRHKLGLQNGPNHIPARNDSHEFAMLCYRHPDDTTLL